jgi:hypothetical protein
VSSKVVIRLYPRIADTDVASRRSRRRKVSIDVDEVSLEIGSLFMSWPLDGVY